MRDWIKSIDNWLIENNLMKLDSDNELYVEFKRNQYDDQYFIVKEIEVDHLVLSCLREDERDVPFDLGGFDASTKYDDVKSFDEFLELISRKFIK